MLCLQAIRRTAINFHYPGRPMVPWTLVPWAIIRPYEILPPFRRIVKMNRRKISGQAGFFRLSLKDLDRQAILT